MIYNTAKRKYNKLEKKAEEYPRPFCKKNKKTISSGVLYLIEILAYGVR